MVDTAKKSAPRRVKTPAFTLCFPHLFTPDAAYEGQEPRYSLVALFDVAAQASPEYKAMRQLVWDVVADKYGPEKAKKLLADPAAARFRLPFREATEKDYNGFEEGMTFISAWTRQAPGVVDPQLKPATSDIAYPGATARATLGAFVYDQSGNRGVSFLLNNVQIVDPTRPRLDGRKSAADEFEAVRVEDGDDDDLPF